jgi:hypothetical protein
MGGQVGGADAGATNHRVETVLRLYNRAHELLKRYATIADRIEVAIIVLSVLTSGAFWALASDLAPKPLGWAGAAISTVVTGLTIYMYASGVQKKRKDALFLFEEIGKYLGEVRGNPHLDEMEFWNRFKVYEGMVKGLPYKKED